MMPSPLRGDIDVWRWRLASPPQSRHLMETGWPLGTDLSVLKDLLDERAEK
jgi:hypothetical protein